MGDSLAPIFVFQSGNLVGESKLVRKEGGVFGIYNVVYSLFGMTASYRLVNLEVESRIHF